MAARIAALALAAGLLPAEPIDLSSPELVADGSALFAKNCAVGYCHGSAGRAARGPALRDRVWDFRDLYRITADGLPGTSMPGWKGVLEDRGVWAVTAYVLSLSSEPPSGSAALVEVNTPTEEHTRAELSEPAALGKALFFDLTRQRRCGVCHALDGLGSSVGPNLAVSASSRPAEDIRRDILMPHERIAYGFDQVELLLESGETLAGVLAEEDESVIRVFDAAAIPPPLRTVRKENVERQRTLQRSSMPNDIDRIYSEDEIDAIVRYLMEAAR